MLESYMSSSWSCQELRRLHKKQRNHVNRLLREAEERPQDGPFCHPVAFLSVADALTRTDLAPVVEAALQTAYLVRMTGEQLDGCACMACEQAWDINSAAPALALVVARPEEQLAGVSLTCETCARRPDIHALAIAFLRQIYPEASLRPVCGLRWR
jgi:hypothetical protein